MSRVAGLFVGLWVLWGSPSVARGQTAGIPQRWLPPYDRAYRLAWHLKVDSARGFIAGKPAYTPDPYVADESLVRRCQQMLCESLARTIEQLAVARISPEKIEEALLAQEDLYDELDDLPRKVRKHPWVRHTQSELRLHQALIEMRHDRAVEAGRHMLRAYHMAESLGKDFPEFWPAQKSLGLYETVIGMIPGGVISGPLKFMLGLRGTTEAGIERLRQSSIRSHAQQDEARLLYGLILIYMKDEAAAGLPFLESLVAGRPDHTIGLTMLAGAQMRLQRRDLALETIQKAEPKPGQLLFRFPLKLEGELWLQKLDYERAIDRLDRYLSLGYSDWFVKSAHYQLFLASYLSGQEGKANRHFFAIGTEGKKLTDADRYADYFAKRAQIPDKSLLRARLLFDGGQHARALDTLDRIEAGRLVTLTEQVEVGYRRARIAQLQERFDDAERLYQYTVTLAGNDPSYFAPAACLYLGRMLVKQGRKREAKPWLEKVSTYRRHEYKETLDQMARTTLDEIR